jgi:hypothetical protein
MNTLELKGSLVGLIAQINDQTLLIRMIEAYKNIISESNEDEENDWWDDLPIEQQIRLTKSIEESYNPENLIDHAVMQKKHAKWLRK